ISCCLFPQGVKELYPQHLWPIDYRPWTMDHGPWTMDYGLWTMDYGPSTINLSEVLVVGLLDGLGGRPHHVIQLVCGLMEVLSNDMGIVTRFTLRQQVQQPEDGSDRAAKFVRIDKSIFFQCLVFLLELRGSLLNDHFQVFVNALDFFRLRKNLF